MGIDTYAVRYHLHHVDQNDNLVAYLAVADRQAQPNIAQPDYADKGGFVV
jgi:hypothetical protein